MSTELIYGETNKKTPYPYYRENFLQDVRDRFKSARELEEDSLYKEALKLFEKNIAEEPKSLGSLLRASSIALHLGFIEKASHYIESFRILRPEDYRGIILAIQTNRALGKNKTASKLSRKLRWQHNEKIALSLNKLKSYPCDLILQEEGKKIEIREFFKHKKSPYYLWTASELNKKNKLLARSAIFFKKKRHKKGRYYLVFFEVKDGEEMEKKKIVRKFKKKPNYESARTALLEALHLPSSFKYKTLPEKTRFQEKAPPTTPSLEDKEIDIPEGLGEPSLSSKKESKKPRAQTEEELEEQEEKEEAPPTPRIRRQKF